MQLLMLLTTKKAICKRSSLSTLLDITKLFVAIYGLYYTPEKFFSQCFSELLAEEEGVFLLCFRFSPARAAPAEEIQPVDRRYMQRLKDKS